MRNKNKPFSGPDLARFDYSLNDLIGRRFTFMNQHGALVPIKELPSATWIHPDGSIQPVLESGETNMEHNSDSPNPLTATQAIQAQTSDELTSLRDYYDRLNSHDWFYEYANGRTYSNGLAVHFALKRESQTHPIKADMFSKFAKYHYGKKTDDLTKPERP